MAAIKIAIRRLLILLMLLALTTRADAAVELHDARIRLLPGDLPLAGYLTVVNNSGSPVVIVGAGSPVFGMIMLHRSVEHDGQSSMQPVAELPVAAGTTVRLAPGGYHLMLMHGKRRLVVGDTVPIAIEFADGSHRTVMFSVKGAMTQ